MRTLAVFVLAFVLTSACAPSLTMRTDPSFTEAERVQIIRAAERWNEVTKPTHRISIKPSGEWYIDEAIIIEDATGVWNGRVLSSQRLVQIDNDPAGTTTYHVALHEFGHVLGLRHTTRGVMQDGPSMVAEGIIPPGEFAPEDIGECKRVGACP